MQSLPTQPITVMPLSVSTALTPSKLIVSTGFFLIPFRLGCLSVEQNFHFVADGRRIESQLVEILPFDPGQHGLLLHIQRAWQGFLEAWIGNGSVSVSPHIIGSKTLGTHLHPSCEAKWLILLGCSANFKHANIKRYIESKYLEMSHTSKPFWPFAKVPRKDVYSDG